MTRPCRRITLHLSQIFLTLGLTFTVLAPLLPWLLVPVDDATAGQVVRGELHDHSVLGEDADVVLAHLAADVRQDLVTIGELDAEHGVRQRLDNAPLDLDGAFLLRHVLLVSVLIILDCRRDELTALAGRSKSLREHRPRSKSASIHDHRRQDGLEHAVAAKPAGWGSAGGFEGSERREPLLAAVQ